MTSDLLVLVIMKRFILLWILFICFFSFLVPWKIYKRCFPVYIYFKSNSHPKRIICFTSLSKKEVYLFFKPTLEMVMKSGPKKTDVTPSIWKSCLASGDLAATLGLGASKVPSSSTLTPGRNLRLFGLGVSWVWMKRDLPGEETLKLSS